MDRVLRKRTRKKYFSILFLSLILVALFFFYANLTGFDILHVFSDPIIINSCQTLNSSGEYSLDQNIGSGGTCITIGANGVILYGNGHTINGNIINGGNGYSFNLYNLKVTGYVSSASTLDSVNGGNIVVVNSSISSYITSAGDSGPSGSRGGSITLVNSTVSTITTTGGVGSSGYAGDGGSITLINSIASTLTASGGTNLISPTSFNGGNGGSITLVNSNISSGIISQGGNGQTGGNGGVIILTNSSVSAISVNGGNGNGAYGASGGSGGAITIINSSIYTAGGLTSLGGSGNNGGNGGSITLVNSNAVSYVDASGGNAQNGGYSGSGGTVIIRSSNVTYYTNSNVGGGDNGGRGGSVSVSLNSRVSTVSANVNSANLMGGTITVMDSTTSNLFATGGNLNSGTGGAIYLWNSTNATVFVSGDIFINGITNMYGCRNLTRQGTYLLASNLSSSSTCIFVESEGINILGNGRTIFGNIDIWGGGYSYNLTNIIVNGNLIADNLPSWTGGNISVINSIVNNISSRGKYGGSITVINSSIKSIVASGLDIGGTINIWLPSTYESLNVFGGILNGSINFYPKYLLSINKNGSGFVGSLISSSQTDQINCGDVCFVNYNSGSNVTIRAIPSNGYSFSGWSTACSGTNTDCILLMNGPKNVTANFILNKYNLSVATIHGAILSSDGKINCGTSSNICSSQYDYGTEVQLTATPDAGYNSGVWYGACSLVAPGSTCSLTLDANKFVNVSFSSSNYLLSVSKIGTGNGNITSNIGGINCGVNCNASIGSGTQVQLTATANIGSTFSGWSSACSGTGTCIINMDNVKSVIANFSSISLDYSLSVIQPVLIQRGFSATQTIRVQRTTGNNEENISILSVSGLPVGIGVNLNRSCFLGSNGICDIILNYTSNLSASIVNNSQIVINVRSESNLTKSVVSNITIFNVSISILNLTISNGGSVITNGTNCQGSFCSIAYNQNTIVELIAIPYSGYSFSGWSGACSGTGTCIINMSSAKSVSANFVLMNSPNPSGGGGGGGGSNNANNLTVNYSEGYNNGNSNLSEYEPQLGYDEITNGADTISEEQAKSKTSGNGLLVAVFVIVILLISALTIVLIWQLKKRNSLDFSEQKILGRI